MLEQEQERAPERRMGRSYFFRKRPGDEEVADLISQCPDRDQKYAVKRRGDGWYLTVEWDPE